MISRKNIKKISLIVLVSVVVIIFFVLNFNFYFSDLLISKLTYQNSIASPHSSLVSKVNNLESDSKIYESIANENKELREQRRKYKALKVMKEEEERKKKIEYIKIKEWEEKFDKEQKEMTISEVINSLTAEIKQRRVNKSQI